jgi:hypothetical protein
VLAVTFSRLVLACRIYRANKRWWDEWPSCGSSGIRILQMGLDARVLLSTRLSAYVGCLAAAKTSPFFPIRWTTNTFVKVLWKREQPCCESNARCQVLAAQVLINSENASPGSTLWWSRNENWGWRTTSGVPHPSPSGTCTLLKTCYDVFLTWNMQVKNDGQSRLRGWEVQSTKNSMSGYPKEKRLIMSIN